MKKISEKIYYNKAVLLSLIVLCIALIGIVLYSLILCRHEWKEATCTEPRICMLCDKIEGEPLGHTWVKANCTTPKTCNVCGITEGGALGHTWEEATCTTPKACNVCGIIEGEPLGHIWVEATCTAPKTCDICGETTGEAVDHEWCLATCISPKACRNCGITEGEKGDIHYLTLVDYNVIIDEPNCIYCGKKMAVRLGKNNWRDYLSIQFEYDRNAKKITSYSQIEGLIGSDYIVHTGTARNWDWSNIYTYGVTGSITIIPKKNNIKFVYIDDTEAKYDFPCIIKNLSYDENVTINTDWYYSSIAMEVPIDENGYGYADIIFPCGLRFNKGVNDSQFRKSLSLEFTGVPNHSKYLAVPVDLKWEFATHVEGLP